MSQNCIIVIAFFLAACQIFTASSLNIERARNNGKYEASSSGKYVADHNKWAYKPDNRGKYVHVHIPYDGGYGPFQNPYEHDGRPYEHDDRQYKDPFQIEVFTDKAPAVYREYGAPLFNSKF